MKKWEVYIPKTVETLIINFVDIKQLKCIKGVNKQLNKSVESYEKAIPSLTEKVLSAKGTIITLDEYSAYNIFIERVCGIPFIFMRGDGIIVSYSARVDYYFGRNRPTFYMHFIS